MSSAIAVRCGLEFEYLLANTQGPNVGQLRDFADLDFHELSALLADKPGRDDPELAVGDMGIRQGYWYLEGDERFHPNGDFDTLAVKGVEIRTPPAQSVTAAIEQLLHIEQQLLERLGQHGLGLAIAGLNPRHERYVFTPPLNAFERQLRAEDHEYDGMEVSTLTFGPDINLSFVGWDSARNLAVARKLNYYAPYIVPFSFSAPFWAGQPWAGDSRRTWVRSSCRPIVKTFVAPKALTEPPASPLLRPARIASEEGRIEFKAFDAMPCLELLKACCYLLIGLCLDEQLKGQTDETALALFRRAAWHGFEDPEVYTGATQVLLAATKALQQHGEPEGVQALVLLQQALERRLNPAHWMRAEHRQYHLGGLAITPTFSVLREVSFARKTDNS